MTSRTQGPRIPLDELRDRIAEALAAHVKAYNLAEVCTSMGLSGGEDDEAYRSKKLYAKKRLISLGEQDLLGVADMVSREFHDETLFDTVSEMTVHADHRVSEITRRDVLKALNGLHPLFGDLDVFEGPEYRLFPALVPHCVRRGLRLRAVPREGY